MNGYMTSKLFYFICIFGFIAQVFGCDEYTAYSTIGTIYSHPSYDGHTNYDNNYFKCWKITAEYSTSIVKLSVVNFELESSISCSFDVFRIYDNDHAGGTFVKKCGSNSFSTIYSSGRDLYLEFDTDSLTTDNGFEISYTQVSSSYYDSSDWINSYWDDFDDAVDIVGTVVTVGMVIAIVIGVVVFLGICICVIALVIILSTKKRGRVIDTAPHSGTTTMVVGQQQNSRGQNLSYVHTRHQRPGVMVPPPAYNQAVYYGPPPVYGNHNNQQYSTQSQPFQTQPQTQQPQPLQAQPQSQTHDQHSNFRGQHSQQPQPFQMQQQTHNQSQQPTLGGYQSQPQTFEVQQQQQPRMQEQSSQPKLFTEQPSMQPDFAAYDNQQTGSMSSSVTTWQTTGIENQQQGQQRNSYDYNGLPLPPNYVDPAMP